MKAKKKKKMTSTSEERKNFRKPSSAAGISIKGKNLAGPAFKILRTCLKIEERKSV